jgi:hypothetical protein
MKEKENPFAQGIIPPEPLLLLMNLNKGVCDRTRKEGLVIFGEEEKNHYSFDRIRHKKRDFLPFSYVEWKIRS